MRKPRIKPVHNKPIMVKGKIIGHYSMNSRGEVTIRTKPPKF